VTPREEELLTGMGNCYAACQEGFDETVRMVAHARDLSREEVLAMLRSMKTKYAGSPRYEALRARFPKNFPV
jgi:hypothetical protein